MRGMWEKLWVRALCALIGTPVIMTASLLLTIFVYALFSQGLTVAASDILPPPSVTGCIAVVEWVTILPLFIAMEISNRRLKQVLPPGIAAIFPAVLTIAFIGLMTAIMEITQRLNDWNAGWLSGVMFLLGSYLGGIGIAFGLLWPVIKRWHQRSAALNSSDAADLF